jgi:Isochorismatase family
MDFTIKPKEENEIVINKHTGSIFIDTGFERMLRNAGIITIVFTVLLQNLEWSLVLETLSTEDSIL